MLQKGDSQADLKADSVNRKMIEMNSITDVLRNVSNNSIGSLRSVKKRGFIPKFPNSIQDRLLYNGQDDFSFSQKIAI